MAQDVELVEVWRGGRRECVHRGHAVVVAAGGDVVQAWGDPGLVMFPRSSCKMLQALPMVCSGAADAAGLGTEQLALSCASHSGAAIHTDRVRHWITGMGMADDDFRCGAHMPQDEAARDALIRADKAPCQIHNNCSGKHAGFLTMNRHLGGGPDYVDPDHPLQRTIRTMFEEVTGEDSPGYGIDGCSAPNFATTLTGLGRAMADFAGAAGRSGVRAAAQVRLTEAMMAHPDLINGPGRACSDLMRACNGQAAIKGGAEGVYVAILPEKRMAIALKISDGAARASEAAITALLIRAGVLDADHPTAIRYGRPPQTNWRGLVTGDIRPAAALA